MNQSEFLAITWNSLEAWEKSRVHGFGFGFGFASHWLKNWRESFKPITKRSNRLHVITLDCHLKTTLYQISFYLSHRDISLLRSLSGRSHATFLVPRRVAWLNQQNNLIWVKSLNSLTWPTRLKLSFNSSTSLVWFPAATDCRLGSPFHASSNCLLAWRSLSRYGLIVSIIGPYKGFLDMTEKVFSLSGLTVISLRWLPSSMATSREKSLKRDWVSKVLWLVIGSSHATLHAL